MTKEQQIMKFLKENVFDPILRSKTASLALRKGVDKTIRTLKRKDAIGMVQYYWSSILGTGRSAKFAKLMKKEGFTRFEEVIDEFRERFNDAWLRT